MRSIPLLCVICFLAACASDPREPAASDEGVYVTGSNIKRHDYRPGSDHVVTGVPADSSSGTTGSQVR